MYKTIVLELLSQRPEIQEQLRKSQMLLPALTLLARQLRDSHEAWKDRLSQARPGSGESQIASESLEIALKELEDNLTSRVLTVGSEPLSLDGAMAFIGGRKPPV